MTRAVLLGRVSRDEGQDQESQLVALRAAAQRHGWTVVEEVSLRVGAWDKDASRLVQEKVLAPIKEGRADILAVWALDRVTRGGPLDAFRFLAILEDHYKATFYSLQEPFLSTATNDPASRELMLSLLAWVAKWESQRKSDRLKAKAQAKRNRAQALGEKALWGKGRLATEGDVANVWRLRGDGATIRVIAADLGLSKSLVGRILQGVPPQQEGQAVVSPVENVPSTQGGLGQR